MLSLLLACTPSTIDLGKTNTVDASTTATSDTGHQTVGDTANTAEDSTTSPVTDSETTAATTHTGTVEAQFMISGNGMQMGSCKGSFSLSLDANGNFVGEADCKGDAAASGPLLGTLSNNRIEGTWEASVWNQSYSFPLKGGGPPDAFSASFSLVDGGFQGQGTFTAKQ